MIVCQLINLYTFLRLSLLVITILCCHTTLLQHLAKYFLCDFQASEASFFPGNQNRSIDTRKPDKLDSTMYSFAKKKVQFEMIYKICVRNFFPFTCRHFIVAQTFHKCIPRRIILFVPITFNKKIGAITFYSVLISTLSNCFGLFSTLPL